MSQVVAWMVWCSVFITPVLAQGSGGVFRGEVKDETGAALGLARVVITSLETGLSIATETNGHGIYVAPLVLPGRYRLTGTKDAFKTSVFGPVTIRVDETVRVDFQLNVGAVNESIEVAAAAAQLLATESSDVFQSIAERQVAQLPLNGRRWQQLIALSAGVNPGSPGETGSPNSVNVNGQRNKANLFLADGVPVTSSTQGRGNGFNIPLEAVREFSVRAGSYSAEYGNVAGGLVNIQTKSGTNDWHGSLFEYLRHDRLDAANFFSNATKQPKNPLRYHQFGGSLGGPILRNRTFLFADYQGTLTRSGTPLVTTVRPNEQRAGDFSNLRAANGSVIPIFDPNTAGTAPAAFPGNRIPTNRIDSAAAALSALLPQPNQFDRAGQSLAFNNFAVTRTSVSENHSFDLRLDHQLSAVSTAYVRHSFQDMDTSIPSLFGLPLGGPPVGAGTTRSRFQNTGIGHLHQFSPAWLNEFRVSLNRITAALRQEDYGRNLATEFGIPGVNRSPETSGLPYIGVAGVFTLGGSLLTPLRLATTHWNVSDKMTWIAGRHAVRMGVDFQYEMGSTGYLVFGRGSYAFSSLNTAVLTPQGAIGGDAFASFLTGVPLQVLRDSFPAGLVGLLLPRFGFYLQDDIRLSSRLTINLGARYDVMPYAREKYNRLSNFDPGTRTMLLAGIDTRERLRRTDYTNLAPRIGLAYAPGANTVLRAGYGIGYIDPVGSASVLNSAEFNIPFYFRENLVQFPVAPPRYTLSTRLADLRVPSPAAPSGDQRYLVPNDRNQYSQTWSFSVQHAFRSSLMAEIAYVGTSGSRLLLTSNINAARPGMGDPVQRRPFGTALADVRALSNSGHSTYHGLQAKVEQRLASGIYFLASYTWSKALDNQSTGTDDAAAGGQSPQNPANHRLDRGLSSFDRTHRFVASASWDLPYESNRRLGIVLGGWQLSGILEAQTGAPFSVVMPCSMIGAEGNNCRPHRIAGGSLWSEDRSIQAWFDKNAFRIPSPAAYGSAGRNILRGPGSATMDLMLAKSFLWNDRARVQIRSEFFNALNHTNLGLPVRSMDSPAIGSITNAAPARIIQIAARVEF